MQRKPRLEEHDATGKEMGEDDGDVSRKKSGWQPSALGAARGEVTRGVDRRLNVNLIDI